MNERSDRIPTVYRAGYEKARLVAPEAAANFVDHILVGDPISDAAAEALAPCGQMETHRLIRAGMEREHDFARDAPPALVEFFERVSVPPAWFDPAKLLSGMRAYHRDSDLFIAAHVAGVLVEGFATTIARFFLMTGRLTDHGVRRLRQNNRHLIEICMPGGLERHGDGWKLTVRIRLVHAQVRRLIRESGKWDEGTWGTPLSAAHIAFASAVFSALLLHKAQMLGVRLDRTERDSFMDLWRYTAWLMGVPETILFRDYDEAMALCRTGCACEPPPGEEAIIMANAMIRSAPLIVGAEGEARRTFTTFVYRVSRALVGDELADQLRFPRLWTAGLLPLLRWRRRVEKLHGRLAPGRARSRRARNFSALLERSLLDDMGISYRLPDRLADDMANPW